MSHWIMYGWYSTVVCDWVVRVIRLQIHCQIQIVYKQWTLGGLKRLIQKNDARINIERRLMVYRSAAWHCVQPHIRVAANNMMLKILCWPRLQAHVIAEEGPYEHAVYFLLILTVMLLFYKHWDTGRKSEASWKRTRKMQQAFNNDDRTLSTRNIFWSNNRLNDF